MKINGTIFSKPQQDQLKRGIGTELDKVVTKVDDVDARMLNYMGDWASGNEYHENDVVTWGTDGHLYEVIKAHTSSVTFGPDNPEYYKAMTARKFSKIEGTINTQGKFSINLYNILRKQSTKGAFLALTPSGRSAPIEFAIYNANISRFYLMAPNVTGINTSDASLHMGELVCTAPSTQLSNNRIIAWAKNSEGVITASSVTLSDTFTLYYEQ